MVPLLTYHGVSDELTRCIVLVGISALFHVRVLFLGPAYRSLTDWCAAARLPLMTIQASR
jgi:hypothetical protein